MEIRIGDYMLTDCIIMFIVSFFYGMIDGWNEYVANIILFIAIIITIFLMLTTNTPAREYFVMPGESGWWVIAYLISVILGRISGEFIFTAGILEK